MTKPSALIEKITASPLLILIGVGREGWSSYQWLRQNWPDKPILAVDDADPEKLPAEFRSIQTSDHQLRLLTSSQLMAEKPENVSGAVAIRTPGFSPFTAVVKWLSDQGVSITTNTQLFWDQLPDSDQILTIGVTGTKGKSTTTAAIHHVLSDLGMPSVLGGNIGIPPLSILPEVENKLSASSTKVAIVLELSAHQLYDVNRSPQIAVVLNVVPEHLDYYPDFDTYLQAKRGLTRFQQAGDTVVYDPHSLTAVDLAHSSPGTHLWYQSDDNHTAIEKMTNPTGTMVAEIKNGSIWYQDQPVVELQQLAVKGAHTHYNLLPSVIVASQQGFSSSQIGQALRSFKGLPHRLELVSQARGAEWYDDSLATVPQATIEALRAFPGKQIVLLAGGYERHQDFTELAQTLTKLPVAGLLLFKPTGERLAAHLQSLLGDRFQALGPTTAPSSPVEPGVIRYAYPATMAEAVALAAQLATPGTVVLLSPGSASFGQFKDYEDRSQQFVAAIEQLPPPAA